MISFVYCNVFNYGSFDEDTIFYSGCLFESRCCLVVFELGC